MEDNQPDAGDGVGADIQPDAVCTDHEPDAGDGNVDADTNEMQSAWTISQMQLTWTNNNMQWAWTMNQMDAVSMDGGLLTLQNEGIDCTEPQSVRVCDISPLPQLKNNTSRRKRRAETAEVITSSPYRSAVLKKGLLKADTNKKAKKVKAYSLCS